MIGVDHPNIYSVRIDGSDRKLLVENATRPAYSPDGTKLAYRGYGVGNEGVFVANADGSDPYSVSSRIVGSDGPSWSPDGNRLAFVSRGDIVVARADGSGERVIAAFGSRSDQSAMRWSPDGRLVAFVHRAIYRPFRSSIVVARADGSGLHVIGKSRRSVRALHSLAWRPAARLPAAARVPCRVR
jgi:Tol biopolymer transport system component